jgi:hypothetical protein
MAVKAKLISQSRQSEDHNAVKAIAIEAQWPSKQQPAVKAQPSKPNSC